MDKELRKEGISNDDVISVVEKLQEFLKMNNIDSAIAAMSLEITSAEIFHRDGFSYDHYKKQIETFVDWIKLVW